MDQIIYRHLLEQTSEAEEKQLFDWLESGDENRRFFFEIAAIWHAHRVLSSQELNQRYTAMMNRLNARIDADERMRGAVQPKPRRLLFRLAAAAAVVVAAITIGFAFKNVTSEHSFRSYINNSQEIATLRLDDGTEVWLQANTELRYDVDKSSDERIVRLLGGEAFFDVARDEAHPFLVKTDNLTVRVLGTAFNVKSIDAGAKTEVVLERGSVRLQTPGGENLIRLHPNQKATLDSSTDDFEVEEIFAEHFVTSRYDLIAMKNATIREIILSVEKNYGVKLRVSDADTLKRYDINYLRSNTLQEVIDIVEFMTGRQCELTSTP